eukprot:tig00020553_g10776.t1
MTTAATPEHPTGPEQTVTLLDSPPDKADSLQSPSTERLLKHAPCKVIGDACDETSPSREVHSPATTSVTAMVVIDCASSERGDEDLDGDINAGDTTEGPDQHSERARDEDDDALWSEGEGEDGGAPGKRKRQRTFSEGSELAAHPEEGQAPAEEPAGEVATPGEPVEPSAAGAAGAVASAEPAAPSAAAAAAGAAAAPAAAPAAPLARGGAPSAAAARGGAARRGARPAARGGRPEKRGDDRAYEREKRGLRIEITEHPQLATIGARYFATGLRLSNLPKAQLLALAQDLGIDLAKFSAFTQSQARFPPRLRARAPPAAAAPKYSPHAPSHPKTASSPYGERRRLRDEIVAHPRFQAERKQLMPRGHARISQLSREECAELARKLGIDLSSYPSFAPRGPGAPDGPVRVNPSSPWAKEDDALPEFGWGYAEILGEETQAGPAAGPSVPAGPPLSSSAFAAEYEASRRRLVDEIRSHPNCNSATTPVLETDWLWLKRATLLEYAGKLGLDPMSYYPFFTVADLASPSPAPAPATPRSPAATAADPAPEPAAPLPVPMEIATSA